MYGQTEGSLMLNGYNLQSTLSFVLCFFSNIYSITIYPAFLATKTQKNCCFVCVTLVEN